MKIILVKRVSDQCDLVFRPKSSLLNNPVWKGPVGLLLEDMVLKEANYSDQYFLLFLHFLYPFEIQSFETYGICRLQMLVCCNIYFINPFPNNKFSTLQNSKCLQMTVLNLMKMAESSPNR